MLFSQEEIELAKNVDLCDLAEGLGYTIIKAGKCHSLKEHDSIRIYNRNTWYQWSCDRGGNPINFLMNFEDMNFIDAVKMLLNSKGYVQKEMSIRQEKSYKESYKEEKIEFQLPQKASNYRRMYAYLIKTRGLSKATVDFFVRRNMLYESEPYHNVVFLGTDRLGKPYAAFLRGTMDAVSIFKGNALGSDDKYGFHLSKTNYEEVQVFESGIDMMSYIDLYGFRKNNYLSLATISDNALIQYIKEYPEIKKIKFSLDNDIPGKKAMEQLKEKYERLGYEIAIETPPEKYKDWNEFRKMETKKVEKILSR